MKLKIRDFAKVTSGSTPSRSKHEDYFENGTVPWVKTMDLTNGPIISTDEKITPLAAKTCKPYQAGTVLVAMYGGFKQIGRTGLLVYKAAINQALSAIDVNRKKCTPEYLIQYLNHDVMQWRRFAASSRKDPNITSADVRAFQVILPPLPEQKAIADLLSTWDEAIEKTERLILVKETRFKRLLNDLIHQGRSNHTWTGYNLSDLCSLVSRKNGENNTNVLTSSAQNGLVSQLEYYNKSVSSKNVTGYYLLKKGEFAYNRSSAKGYPYGATKRLDRYEKGVLSTLYLCFALKSNAPCESDFLLHLFESGATNRELRAVCQEGARSHGLLNITKSDFFGIKLFLPDQDQQKKIQSALNTAQDEIDLLKQLADKYKTQKRGLMQKMLTGEWRVKPEIVNQYMEA